MFNRATRLKANIISATLQDLGLVHIQHQPNGQVAAVCEGVSYVFDWDYEKQQLVIVHRYDPREMIILELVA